MNIRRHGSKSTQHTPSTKQRRRRKTREMRGYTHQVKFRGGKGPRPTRWTKHRQGKQVWTNKVTIPKYLGIILDRKSNVEARREKTLIAWYTSNKCLGKKWGLKPYILRWIYTAVVRPVLCYGALVWWNTIKVSCRKTRLATVQRQACLGISGVMRSTPQAALEVMLNVIPLELFLEELACKSAARLSILGYFKAG